MSRTERSHPAPRRPDRGPSTASTVVVWTGGAVIALYGGWWVLSAMLSRSGPAPSAAVKSCTSPSAVEALQAAARAEMPLFSTLGGRVEVVHGAAQRRPDGTFSCVARVRIGATAGDAAATQTAAGLRALGELRDGEIAYTVEPLGAGHLRFRLVSTRYLAR